MTYGIGNPIPGMGLAQQCGIKFRWVSCHCLNYLPLGIVYFSIGCLIVSVISDFTFSGCNRGQQDVTRDSSMLSK